MNLIRWLVWMLLPVSQHLMADAQLQDRMILYLRGDIRNAEPDIVTVNGVYDLNTQWGTLETALRAGTYTNQPGLWSYKIEGITPEFWGNHRLALRVVKNNDYPSTGSVQDTRVAQRVMGAYQPFASLDALSSLSVHLDAGVAENFTGAHGATLLPNGQGALNILPIWAVKLGWPSVVPDRKYVLSWSNFDIFDPYPASQPFLQFEVQQEVEKVMYYGYVRYRWDDTVDQFYALYLTLGLELPN